MDTQGWRSRAVGLFPAILIVILTFALTIPIISRNSSWSPIDEQTHIDYAWRISHGEIPRAGDHLAREVLADWSCSGQENAELPACGFSAARAEDYPNRGENYNYFQTPIYYLIAGSLARSVTALTGASNFDTVLRYFSSGFTAIGLVLLYSMMRKWGVQKRAAFFASILVLTFPNVLGSATRVTPDSVAVLSAVAVVFSAHRVLEQHRFGVVIPALLTVVLTGMKALGALPMLCLALYLLLSGLFGRLRAWRPRALGVAFVIPVSFVVVYGAWSKYQGRYVPAGWVTPVQGINTTPVLGSPFGEWLNSPVNGADLAAGGSFPSTVSAPLLAWLALGLGCLSVVGSLAAWIMLDRKDPWRSVAFTLLIGVMLWPVLVQIQAFMGDVPSFFPHVSPRYGVSLIGLLGVSLGMVAVRREVVSVLAAVSGMSYLLALGAALGILSVPV